MGDSILKSNYDSVRIAYCDTFNNSFEQLLNDPQSFQYVFDSLKSVSVLTSKDKSVRVYSWLLPSVSRDRYNYFGFVQLHDRKLKTTKLFKLENNAIPDDEIEKKSLPCNEWYGAIYYKMIENKKKNGKAYTLLGWRGNNLKTTIKLMDVLVTDKNVPKFGAPIFKSEKGMKHRVVFEYTARAVMSLKYDEKKKMIIYDHLSPSDPLLKGNYESYGPDMTYDGYKFKDARWNYVKNIEAENPSEYDRTRKDIKKPDKQFYKTDK